MPMCWRWGTGPSCPTSCPCAWECRAWLGQCCLCQVSRTGWQAPCLCWQGGWHARAREGEIWHRVPSAPAVGPSREWAFSGAGNAGGCSQQGLTVGEVKDSAPSCSLPSLPVGSPEDAASPSPGAVCACPPGPWASSCAYPTPSAPTPGPSYLVLRCQKLYAGFSSGRALCSSMPVLEWFATFYWCFINDSEEAASAACAMGLLAPAETSTTTGPIWGPHGSWQAATTSPTRILPLLSRA